MYKQNLIIIDLKLKIKKYLNLFNLPKKRKISIVTLNNKSGKAIYLKKKGVNLIKIDSLDSKSEEVIVIKLVGGTNAYVRRPFLYTGLCYGSFGGILSWIFIAIAVYWLSIPIEKLSALYQSSIELEGLGFFGLISLISIGVSLGLLGAWLSVTRQLSAIEPK